MMRNNATLLIHFHALHETHHTNQSEYTINISNPINSNVKLVKITKGYIKRVVQLKYQAEIYFLRAKKSREYLGFF